MRGLRPIPIAMLLLALGGGGYALASAAASAPRLAITIGCDGRRSLMSLSGRLPAGATDAYLLYPDGASRQAVLRGDRYRFLLAATGAGSRPPGELEYLDAHGAHHELRVPQARLRECERVHAILARRRIQVEYDNAPFRRRRGESDRAWATRLLNAATVHILRTDPACGPDRVVPPPQPVHISDGAPAPQLLGTLAVLDRAPTHRELALPLPPRQMLGWPGIYTLFRRYTRVVDDPGGFVTTITVGEGQASRPAVGLPACQRLVRAYLAELLHGQPAAVRNAASHLPRGGRLAPQFTGVQPLLAYSVSRRAGIGAGAFTAFEAARFRSEGIVGSGMFSSRHPHRSTVYGLVPDDVATVTLELPAHDAPYYHERYPEPFRATATVRQNTFVFPQVPRDAAVAMQRPVFVWRDAHGRVVRVS